MMFFGVVLNYILGLYSLVGANVLIVHDFFLIAMSAWQRAECMWNDRRFICGNKHTKTMHPLRLQAAREERDRLFKEYAMEEVENNWTQVTAKADEEPPLSLSRAHYARTACRFRRRLHNSSFTAASPLPRPEPLRLLNVVRGEEA